MSLSNREEKLALGVFVVLMLAGLSIATSRVRAWRASLWEQEVTVETREVEANELRNGGVLWEERRSWIKESIPVHANDGDAKSSLLSAVQEAAGTHSVSLQNSKFVDGDADGKAPAPGGLGTNQAKGLGLVVTASGDLKSLVFWWQELLQPGRFRQINFLKMIPEDDNSAMLRCSVEIWQWYRLSPESPGAAGLSAAP
jgi:hypothetical protein